MKMAWVAASLSALLMEMAGASVLAEDDSLTTQWVTNFEGDSQKYWVMRGQKKLPISALMSLQPNDVVDFANPADWIELHLEKHGSFFVCRVEKAGRPCDGAPPFKVPLTKASLTLSDQIVGWLKTTLSDWLNNHQNTSAQDAVPNRGDQISVSLLAAIPTRVVEGNRKICLAWSGPSSPYRLRISDATTRARLLDADIQNASPWCSQEVELKQGGYNLLLTSGEQSFETTVYVVGQKDVPRIPAEVLTGLSSDLQRTVEAAWLASQGDGVWVWEAYLRVASQRATFRPAEVLCRALESGSRPEQAPVKQKTN